MSEQALIEAVDIRPMIEKDFPFVISTWLKSYRYNSPFGKKLKNAIYFKFHHAIAERVLKRQSCRVYIGCSREDPDIILGYIIFELLDTPEAFNIVHYIYTKESFRKLGIAARLFNKTNIDLDKVSFTHWTTDCFWINKKHPEITHNPYLI